MAIFKADPKRTRDLSDVPSNIPFSPAGFFQLKASHEQLEAAKRLAKSIPKSWGISQGFHYRDS